MDANGTRFHLLLGQADWAACTDDQQRLLGQAWASANNPPGVAWDPARAEVTLQPRLLRSAASPRAVPLTLADRRGAACDRFGNWYWISRSRNEIVVHSSGSDTTTHFWAADDALDPPARFGAFQVWQARPPAPPVQLSGLTVTEDHYLVVGRLEPAGLWIFDLHAGHAPRSLLWPQEVPFVPFDMAPRPGGGVWILDRDNARYWTLDRHFNVCADGQVQVTVSAPAVDFQPRDASSPRRTTSQTFPEGILLTAASPVNAADAVAIASMGDDSLLILDRAPDQSFGRVLHYRSGRQLGAAVSLASVGGVVESDPARPFRLHGHDLAFLPSPPNNVEDGLGRAYVVADDGSQTFALLATLQGDQLALAPLETFLPMRQFGGKALVGASTGQPAYDFADRWLPLLAQPRARYEANGMLQSPPLDGREPNCVWHRLMLDACIPAETQVQISTRAADELGDLAVAEWQREPDVYLRGDGSEQRLPGQSSSATAEGTGTWELLFQRARGRFLQIKLDLLGNGRSSPRIRALRAYYPRFSYLDHYLPAAYGEDGVSASFVDRFLANVEGFYTALEDRLAGVEVLFDYRSAPPETLAWLAGWFGLVLDPAWDERRRRLLIKHAMDFFQFRGTLRGLEMALRFLIDPWPDDAVFDSATPWTAVAGSAIRIIEDYQTRQTPRVALGDPTDLLRPVTPASRTARWTPAQGATVLNTRYVAFLRNEGVTVPTSTEFPLSPPHDETTNVDLAGLWMRFAREALGFVPSAGPADLPVWRNFLARRYTTLSALATAYESVFASFDAAALPSVLPRAAAPLRDWFHFEGVVLAMRRTAHRFTVLLPAPTATTPTTITDDSQHLLDLASRLLDLEKPAHTVCAVKLFWPMFRVGAVRLGMDTVLDQGSRAPQLMPKLTLQQGPLAASYLAPSYPWDVSDRQILGRP